MMIYIAWSPPLPPAWVVSTPLTQLLNKQKSKHNERTFQAVHALNELDQIFGFVCVLNVSFFNIPADVHMLKGDTMQSSRLTEYSNIEMVIYTLICLQFNVHTYCTI